MVLKVSQKLFDGAVIVLLPKLFDDSRGRFIKTFHTGLFEELGLPVDWREEFYSISKKGVIRGMHYQSPPEDHHKMIYCLSGRVLDVILDLRDGSPTYGSHVTFEISAEKGEIIIIPSGFAHGFCTLSDETIMQYKVSSIYSPEHDTGVLWNSFGCAWPYDQPIISDRDTKFPPLSSVNPPFKYEE